MYQLVDNMIGHTWDASSYSSSEQQIIYYICGVLIIVLTVVFIDGIKQVFRHFMRP